MTSARHLHRLVVQVGIGLPQSGDGGIVDERAVGLLLGVHEVILAHVLAEDWVGKLRTRGLDDGLAVLAIGPVFALGRAAARAFALGASALHRAAVRAFASSAFVPSAFAGLYDARVVRRHILVGHTGIRGSRRGAVGSPRRPSHRARRGQNRREARSPEARYPAAS